MSEQPAQREPHDPPEDAEAVKRHGDALAEAVEAEASAPVEESGAERPR